MPADFEKRVRSYVPDETLNVQVNDRDTHMMELDDGSLMGVSRDGRSISHDGGRTWGAPEPLSEIDGRPIDGDMIYPLRLKSGGIGAVVRRSDPDESTYDLWFIRSGDEGETWSRPARMSPLGFNAIMHAPAVVTSSGRIVAACYNIIGRPFGIRSRASLGDYRAVIGHHGDEHFFSYCWVYYSDDEGETWHTNEGIGKWAGGGELFVTLNHGAGGFHRTNEPALAEVSPGHLLMLLRTALGRLYQSWSSDDGTTWSDPEPTALASSLAPPSLKRIPGTGDLLVVWSQASADEIERGLQRNRLSTAISKDGGITWQRGRNVFSIYEQEGDRTYVEPPPIQYYRAMDLAPRMPPEIVRASYPQVAFWKDQTIVRFVWHEQTYTIVGADNKILPPEERRGVITHVHVSLPTSWFFEGLHR